MYIFAILKLTSYWTEVQQMLHDVARSWQTNLLKSELRYSTPFRNAKAMNECESADFAHLTVKLVVMATTLERSEKEGKKQ